ncbi:MAG TPA: hypothetical protein VIJ39_00165 [Solirubrobacteraceae bacterium]
MKRKIRIATVLTLAGFLTATVPLAAFASSPLLSGYGGPGTGEQAIIGSTLLKGSGGGTGSGGAGSRGAGSDGSTGAQRATGARRGSTVSSSSSGSDATTGGVGVGDHGRALTRTPHVGTGSTSTTRPIAPHGSQVQAFVYPSALASPASASSAIEISSSDLLLLVGIIATLGLVGVFTVRLARLQP